MSDRQLEETVAATASDTVEDRPARATFDPQRFVADREIGRGGMGRVVEAMDVALDRTVAIKQVLSTRPEDVARFEREVRITAQLEHPSIVPVHETGRDPDGRPYYVMRRIEGEPLAQRIAGASTVRDRLELVPSVLAAVDAAAFAHHRKIIHRDIKPANIMLGGHGETHLIDWGLARRLDESDAPATATGDTDEPLTRVGLVYGTVAYMSPEQARGEVVDERADVFALGATLFHVLTGRSPFAGASIAERVASGDDVSLAAIGPEVPPELVTIVAKAMAPLEARYRNAGALAADLRAFLGGRLVAAHRYTPAQRVLRFVRRHRVAVGIAAVATVVAVALGSAAIVNIMRSRDEAAAAEKRAENRAQEAILAEAESVAQHDPARAVLRLAQVPPGTPFDRRRHDIAVVAALRGIPRGVASAAVTRVGLAPTAAFSPDGARVAYTVEGGPLTVCDLETAACRVIAEHAGQQIAWVEHTILDSDPHRGLSAIDPGTGARRTIVEGATGHMWMTAGRIRFVANDRHELREIGLDGGDPRVLATGVEIGYGDEGIAVVFGDHQLRALSPDGEHLLLPLDSSPGSHGVSISVKRQRIAVLAARNEVYELDFAGNRVQHWTLQHVANALCESSTGLFVASESGVEWLTRDVATTVGPVSTSRVGTLTPARDGLAYAYLDGTMGVLEGDIDSRIVQPGAARIFGAPHSPYLVVVMRDGGARWWDLRAIMPRRSPKPSGTLCLVTPSSVIGQGVGAMWTLDRTTGRVTDAIDDLATLPVQCRGQLGSTVYLATMQDGAATFDTATGKIARANLPSGYAVDRTGEAVVFARDDQLVELPGGHAPERIRFTGPGPITQFVLSPRSILVGGTGWLRRIDRATDAAIAIPVTDYDRFGPDETGAVYWVRGNTVTWWHGVTYPPLELPMAPAASVPGPSSGATFILQDNSVWASTPTSLEMIEGPSAFRTIVNADGRMARTEDSSIVMRDLISNVTFTYRLRLRALGMTFEPGGTVIAIGREILDYRDRVPEDPYELASWIARTTNGTLGADGHEVIWPRPAR